jgi:hypothetical protein
MKIKCQCCKKIVEKIGNRKFCSNCALYSDKLRSQLSNYKRRFKDLNKKFYGQVNGAERVR